MTQNLLQATRKRYSAMLKLGVPRMANDSLLSEQELVQSKVENGRLTEEEARPVLEVYKQIAKELQQKFQQGPCGQRLWRPHEDHSMKEPVMAKQWNVRQKRISRAEYDAEMNAIAQELIRTGKMPALEEFVKGIKEAREKYQEPVNLDYLTRAMIVPTLKSIRITWHGWHALRRGLATNLDQLGIKDTVIQAIMRHSSVSITRSNYIKEVRSDVVAAMKKLEETLQAQGQGRQLTQKEMN